LQPTKSTKMENQLDEHLSGNAKLPVSKFPALVKGFIVYFLLLAICGVAYYTIGETLGLLSMLKDIEGITGILLHEATTLFMISLVFLIPGHYLQGIAFPLYDKSIVKSAFVPFFFWFVLLIVSYLGNSIEGSGGIETLPDFFLIFSTVFCWYFSLCLIISWYMKHKNKTWYLGSFLLHWLIASLIGTAYQFLN